MKWEYFIFIVAVVYLSGELISLVQYGYNNAPSALPSTMVQPAVTTASYALPSTMVQTAVNTTLFALPFTMVQPTVNIPPSALPSTTRPERQSSTKTRKRKGQAEVLTDSLPKNEKVDGKRRRK